MVGEMIGTVPPGVRTVTATRYVMPLREGGSLPALVEADDLGIYVLKFRGAGQGPKVLIAELVSGEIARVLGLPIPEIVFVDLDAVLGRSEPDPEIKDLIEASAGVNLGLDYLPGSFAFDPLVSPHPDAFLASAIVWFDAYVTNVDRTVRNTNLLMWHGKIWLIDNGASLYFQYAGPNYRSRSRSRFPQIRDHVLLPYATMLHDVDAEMSARLNADVLHDMVRLIPERWLDDAGFVSAEDHRAAYADYLLERLQSPRPFVEEALHAQSQLL